MALSPKRPKGKPSAGHTMWEVADFLGISVNQLRSLRQRGHITDPTNLKRAVKEYLFYVSEGGTRALIDREKLMKIEMENARTEASRIETEFIPRILEDYITTLTLDANDVATRITAALDGVIDAAVRKQVIKAAIINARNDSAKRLRVRYGT